MDRPRRSMSILTASSLAPSREPDILTAASNIMMGGIYERYESQYINWQNDAWAYYFTIGELGYAMDWKASMASRIHLRAAVMRTGAKKPEFLTDGPVVQLVRDLVQSVRGGEAALMSSLELQCAVPGVGFLVGEEVNDPSGRQKYKFSVKSAREISDTTVRRKDSAGNDMDGFLFRVQEAPGRWRVLPQESLVGRIFDSDPVLSFMPTSLVKSALSTLQEIDMYNRRIIAVLLSRAVFNGFLLIPDEVTLPVNPQFKDKPDPFYETMIDIARRGIKDPGSPGSAFPVPMRVKGEWIEKFKHFTVHSEFDKKIIEGRESALRRLAKQLSVPSGVVEGVQDTNHWNAWVEKEDAVEAHLGPDATNIVNGLTDVYLEPMLRAAGLPLYDEQGDKFVIWYDLSDLIAKPDNAANAELANADGSLKQEVYLETLHFSAEDAPDDKEFKTIALRRLALNGTPIPDSLMLLYPDLKNELDKINPPPPVVDPNGAPGPQPGQSGSPPAAGPTNGTPRPPQATAIRKLVG
jgi:hypothetical protein